MADEGMVETLAEHWGPVNVYAVWQCGGCGTQYNHVPYPLPTTEELWQDTLQKARGFHAEHQAAMLLLVRA